MAVFAIDDGAYILGGVALTQAVVVFGIIYAGRNARAARTLAESTNDAVNHVDKESGELKLIDQVRQHGRQLRQHHEYHRWTSAALVTIADEIGVTVPPVPDEDEEAA